MKTLKFVIKKNPYSPAVADCAHHVEMALKDYASWCMFESFEKRMTRKEAGKNLEALTPLMRFRCESHGKEAHIFMELNSTFLFPKKTVKEARDFIKKVLLATKRSKDDFIESHKDQPEFLRMGGKHQDIVINAWETVEII